MKKNNKVLAIAAKFAIPTFIALVVLALATWFAVAATKEVSVTSGWPGFFGTLVNYERYLVGHGKRLAGQILSNLVAYAFVVGAVVMFILSLVLIRHDNKMRFKAALISLFLLFPSTFGLVGGFINFLGEGLTVCIDAGGKGAICAFLLVFLFLLDFAYYALAVIYLIHSTRTAILVNRGELDPAELQEEEEPKEGCCQCQYRPKTEEEKAERRASLLKEIREIVREELEKVALVRNVEAAPVAEEEDEECNPKNPRAPRVPFAKKIVKADKDLQEKYNEIKNEILAYGASTRLSVGGDTFRLHRKPYVKINLVGKALKVYFALDPKDFIDSPIPVIDASDKNAYAEVPTLLKVKSNLSVKRAKELIALAFNRDGVVRAENVEEHDHVKDIRKELRSK